MSPPWIEALRSRTTPNSRRVISAVALVAAVWVATRTLKGSVTREVELRVPLAAVAMGGRVRAVTVSFRRGDTVIREVSQRWEQSPAAMVTRVSLPEGPCEAAVTVERDARLLSRERHIDVHADEALVLEPPSE